MEPEEQKIPIVTVAEFFAQVPPYEARIVRDYVTFQFKSDTGGLNYFAATPIKLFCNAEHCEKETFFDCKDRLHVSESRSIHVITYTCRHCKSNEKIFPVLDAALDDDQALVTKIGEYPIFGSQTPSRLLSLIGPDIDLFIKGKRSEELGLGIGAYGYYRRVVENQRNRLFDELIRVTKVTTGDAATLELLEKAKAETQFTTAMKLAGDKIPEALKMRGQNPLILLHKPLSMGLHDLSDHECLDLAVDIRRVLIALSNRISEILKDESELADSINRITKVASKAAK